MIILFTIFGITIHWPWWATVIICVVLIILWIGYEIKRATPCPDEYDDMMKQSGPAAYSDEDVKLDKEIDKFLSDTERLDMLDTLDKIQKEFFKNKNNVEKTDHKEPGE